jgi:putative ABC transport system ATP-binding protein
MLRIEKVSKSYQGPPVRVVLREVSLTLETGEYVAIMGESGSGKSTLLNLIAGLDAPDSGRILMNGLNVGALDDDARTRLRRAKIGFVFQAFHLLPHLSVGKNVALPLALNGVHDGAAERVEELLAAVGMSDRRDAAPRELSGGELQRIAVARALVHRPQLVLADEPTGNLDAESAAEVLQLLRAQLRRDGAAGVLVTHSALAAASTDRIFRLSRDGLAPVNGLAAAVPSR